MWAGWTTRPIGAPPHPHGRRGTQVQFVVAATSQKKAAALLGCTLGFLRDYGSETGNEDDLAQALSEPGVVFWREMDDQSRGIWRKAFADERGRLYDGQVNSADGVA